MLIHKRLEKRKRRNSSGPPIIAHSVVQVTH